MFRRSPARSLWTPIALLVALCCAGAAHARPVERADYRVRSTFRTPQNGAWGANESAGNAEFRIQSRFLQVYYGGVTRADEFKFRVELDFRGISGFATEYAGSPYNGTYDVYLENEFVGRFDMNNEGTFGLGALEYDSRHPDPPALPLPANFPDPIDVGMMIRVFAATGGTPQIGDPLPGGVPVFAGPLEERDARGDVNQDGKVDLQDFPYLSDNFDPTNALGPHLGPLQGDFTGDNRSDLADYQMFVANWTERTAPPTLGAVLGVGAPGATGTLRLAANQPNPFRSSTLLRMTLGRASDVSIDLIDVTGARVAKLDFPAMSAGTHDIAFDGRDAQGRPLPNGTYFYRVQAAGETAVRRMVRMN